MRRSRSRSRSTRFEAFLAATVGLILWGSAQVAEATRGAIQSIPREQHEAANALGFGWIGTHAFVIVPQAARRLLPPLVGLLVNIVQNTTIAGLIGVGDVLETGKSVDGAAAVLDRRRALPADLPRRARVLLRAVVPAHAAVGVPRKATRGLAPGVQE